MDIQFWLYIIIGIIIFLARVLKNKEVPAEPTPRREEEPRNVTKTGTPKQLTFEELLKEITEAKQPQKPVHQPPSRSEVVDYDDNLGEEMQDLEEVDYDYRKKDKLYEVYEEAKRQAFARPSLEETMNVSDTVVQFEKFKVFEQKPQRDLLAEYTKDFQDPEGLKKAVVLSEILNRKF